MELKEEALPASAFWDVFIHGIHSMELKGPSHQGWYAYRLLYRVNPFNGIESTTTTLHCIAGL